VGDIATRYRQGYYGSYSYPVQAGILRALQRIVTGRDIVGSVTTRNRPGYCGRYSYSLQAGILRAL